MLLITEPIGVETLQVEVLNAISVPLSVANLLGQCRSGNRDAQQLLYERYHQPAYRLLVQMVGRTDADDLLQDVFLKVFRSLNHFNGKSQFETWIYRVTLNAALQHLRTRRRSRWRTLEGDVMDYKSGQQGKSEDKDLLECALARLEPDLRAMFLLREVEKFSYARISAATQVPEGTVASRLNRARQLLKQHLVELGWEPIRDAMS